MKLSFSNFKMKMTPSKLLTSVFYDHLSFKFHGIITLWGENKSNFLAKDVPVDIDIENDNLIS